MIQPKLLRLSNIVIAGVLFNLLSNSLIAADKATNVSVVIAKNGQLHDEVPLTGTVNSIRNAMISAKEAGYIKSLHVDDGDFVNKGDVILQLDRELADLEVAKVRAQLNESRARQKELERQRDEAAELVTKKHIPSTRYEAALAEVEINKAVIQGLETELRTQKVIAERHTVYAPFTGVVAEKFIEVGQWVENNTTLLNLVELDPLRIEVAAPQFYYNRLNVDTPVRITYDALPKKGFISKISQKIPVSNSSSRTFLIFIEVNNAEQLITPGMSARVNFQLLDSSTKQLFFIPRDAIVQKSDGTKTIWIVTNDDEKEQATELTVITGRSNKDFIEITSNNISVGDRIVVKGNELLQADQTVNVIETLDYNL